MTGAGAGTLSDHLGLPTDRPLRLVAIGAHPDDLEIGSFGLVDRLIAQRADTVVVWIVLTGTAHRAEEARSSAASLLARLSTPPRIELRTHRDGYLPYEAAAVKESLAESAAIEPDLVLAPRLDDAHQDHRLVGELAWQLFRRATVLEYEIPKYDGDLGRVNLYAALSAAQAEAKVDHLLQAYRSQRVRDWFTRDTFMALLRLRGVECRAPGGFAEGFVVRKLVI